MKPDIVIQHKGTFTVTFEGPIEIEVQEIRDVLSEIYKAWNIEVKKEG